MSCADCWPDRHFGFDVERAVYLAVLHRLMVSGSERHASEWRHCFRLPGAVAIALDHAYKAMNWLGEEIGNGRVMTDAIEEALYRHRQPLLGEVSVAFFDTTSLWFEGRGGVSLGQRGHSKDYRPHLNQVVLGIVLDGDDRPIASFLMPGNTADVTTLMPVVGRLQERFGIKRACIVADCGMISTATIADLEARGIDYILGVRERSIREVREDVIDDDGVAVPLVIPRQKGQTQLAIKDVTIAGRRYVLCRNEEEANKDAEARAAILAGLERKLAQGDKALVANTGFRRFRPLGRPAPESARMAAHYRRPRRLERDRSRAGRPPGAAQNRTGADHRPALPRRRHHPAPRFPGPAHQRKTARDRRTLWCLNHFAPDNALMEYRVFRGSAEVGLEKGGAIEMA